ncbi:MAG: hypothetical protein CL843_04005 [Crocinitomicaceae bacterium]|nr:hypothetical protein [Crocinitomicaceae bacterium]|tara:strand:- start:303 stop:518 length:216 start_codon:yes stop_codon:yes gene_type:complete
MNSNIGSFVTTIHNPESVVEIYVNEHTNNVIELKRLNYNRYKKYEYPIEEYLSNIEGFKGIDKMILNALEN